jgi:dihydrofolate reductase
LEAWGKHVAESTNQLRRPRKGDTMRKVTFGVACSLDNYIARADHAVDWLLWNDKVSALMAAYWKTIDSVVMGRKTYEVALKMNQGANPYTDVKTYVCSRTLAKSTDKNVEIVAEDAVQFMRKLKRRKGKDVCLMGGGELAQALFEGNVIDEVGLNIHPVLLGSGIPLFLPMKRQSNLELLSNKTLKNGCVVLMYRVKH